MGILVKYFSLSDNRLKIFNNISWALIGKIIETVRALLVGVLVARYLQPEGYGILNYTVGFVGLFAFLSDFGITGIITREFSKKKTDRNTLFGAAIGIRGTFSIITLLIVLFVSIFSEDNPQLRLYFFIYSFNYIFLSFSSTFRNFFTSQLKNEFIIKSEIFRTVIVASIKIFFILIKADLIAFIIVTSLDSLVVLIFYYWFYRKFYGKVTEFSFRFDIAKKIAKDSLPLLFSGISAMLYQQIDVFMVGKFINVQSVGYYSAALRFISFSIFIPLVVSQTLSPLLMQKLESVGNDVTHRSYIAFRRKFGDLLVYSGVIITIFLFVFARPLISILYGEEYLAGISILKILSLKGLFSAIGYAGTQVIIYEGRARLVYIRNIAGGLINLGLNFMLIPKYGINGVALATILSYSVGTYFSNLFIPMYRKDFILQSDFLFRGSFRVFKYIKHIKPIRNGK